MKLMTTAMRAGGSKHEIDATEYHFQPEGKSLVHVCDVANPAHIKRFLSIDSFSIADGSKAPAKAPVTPEPIITPGPPIIPADAATTMTPATTISTEDATAPTPLEAMTRDELVAIHQEETGKKPHHKWAEDKIIAAIREHAGN
jgi:hypothetical protein